MTDVESVLIHLLCFVTIRIFLFDHILLGRMTFRVFSFTFHAIFFMNSRGWKQYGESEKKCTFPYINKDPFITIIQACYLQKSEAVSLTSIEMSN